MTCLLPLVLCTGVVHAWESVAPGVDFQEFNLPDPNNAFVLRAYRPQGKWIIDTMTGKGQARGGRETVTDLVKRYDDTVNYRKENYHVIAAINGDYFTYETEQFVGGQITAGTLVKRFRERRETADLFWKRDGSIFIDRDLLNTSTLQRVHFQDGRESVLSNVNAPRGTNQMILYTAQYADRTHTNRFGTELLFRADYPLSIKKNIGGTVVEKRVNEGNTLIPFDCAVLSGHGASADLLNHIDVGDTLTLRLSIERCANDPSGSREPGPDWSNAYAAISGDS